MTTLSYPNDVTGSIQITHGSDGRLNVSSRTDGRGYYISRDQGQAYSLTFEHLSAADGEYSFYIQNTSTDKDMVIHAAGLNSVAAARLKLWEVTGTAVGAGDVVPHNSNLSSSNDAVGVFKIDTGGAISGLTTAGIAIDDVQIGANGHEELRLQDRLRLGQNDAIALEMDTTASSSNVYGVVFFFYE